MTPEISEFSYGFALTNELVGWAALSSAPIFPSLIEEGKAGGGYDVKLDMPGIPLYLQFKRSEWMTRKSAKEIKKSGAGVSTPFYRFPITESKKSDQHELLLALDDGSCLVYYAAPSFYLLSEINDAWLNNEVASRSIFVSPQEIGSLDAHSHTVAFDKYGVWICSEARKIDGLKSRDLLEVLQARLKQDPRPMRAKIPEIADHLRAAERRAEARIREKQAEADRRERQSRGGASTAKDPSSDDLTPPMASYALRSPDTETEESFPREPLPTRAPLALSEENRILREAADTATRLFDAQLIIVQSN